MHRNQYKVCDPPHCVADAGLRDVCRIAVLSVALEPVVKTVAVGGDQADRGRRKMDRQDQRIGAGDGGKELPPRQRRLLHVPIGLRRPFRFAALDRMVHQIAGNHCALPLREDVDAAMTGRMPRRRRQRDGIVQRIVVVDQQRLAGFDDRQAVVAEYRARRIGAFGILLFPDRVFAFVENVFRIRERRHPAAIAQRGVPAGMIDVKMGAEHIIDHLVADAEREQLVAPAFLAGKIERRRMALVLAGAGVDQDRVTWRPDHEGLIGNDDHPQRRVEYLRLHPRQMMLEDSFVKGRKEVLRPPPGPFPLDHGINGDVAYPELLHFLYPFCFLFLSSFANGRNSVTGLARPIKPSGNGKTKPIARHASALMMSREASAIGKKKCKIYGFAARLELC
jgi:hypothetical protein